MFVKINDIILTKIKNKMFARGWTPKVGVTKILLVKS